MISVGEHLNHYASCQKAGVGHKVRYKQGRLRARENKNVTAVQSFLSTHWTSLQESLGEKGIN